MTLYKGKQIIANNSGYHPTIFSCEWSDHLKNDIQWLRADNFSYHSGSVYSTAYNELLSEYNNASSTTVTEGSITFKRTPKGYKIADVSQETAILNKYNSDGIAWYYILDTTNTQFKLPRTKFGFEGLRSNVGDDIAESLPSHTHDEYFVFSVGARQLASVYNGSDTGGGIKSISQSITNTSHMEDGVLQTGLPSSSVYQDNAPVQERATQMYLYFYVGEYSQSAIEQTAGITSEQLNAKVDINSLEQIDGSLGMPSTRYTDLTLGASGSTYTAPANGYIFLSSSDASVCLVVGISGQGYYYSSIGYGIGGFNGGTATLPVKEGMTITLKYNGTIDYCRFIYAEGDFNA